MMQHHSSKWWVVAGHERHAATSFEVRITCWWAEPKAHGSAAAAGKGDSTPPHTGYVSLCYCILGCVFNLMSAHRRGPCVCVCLRVCVLPFRDDYRRSDVAHTP